MRKMLFSFALFAIAGALVVAQAPQKPTQPTFETRADLVLVDVSVSDRDGKPIPDLKAEDFDLQVNGQSRPVHTVQFISTQSVETSAPPDPRAAAYTTNEEKSTGRLLLFVVDENYLRVGGGRAVLRTAGRVLDTLAPGDLVGLARLPDGDGGVEFTTDHARVRRALERVTGKQPSRRTQPVRLNEADAFDKNDRYVWEQVIDRECRAETGFGREACINQLEAMAKDVLSDAGMRTSFSIRALEQLMSKLAFYKMPINLILISEGLFVSRDRNDLTVFARLAAVARVSFFVVQPDESMFDMDTPGTVGGFSESSALAEGLEQIAGHTRGTYFKASTSGAGIFDRISREISAYYLLSFEPTDADRSARARRIKVEVKRRGLTVRSRSTYALPDTAAAAAAAAMPPEKQLEELLSSPLPTSGLPIRVATYSVTNAQDAGKVRVILSAEIGDAAAEAADWPIGMLVIDKDDKAIVNSHAPMKLSPASLRTPTPRLLLTSMLLEPGEYRLRLAALGPEGRSGAVHHVIDARLDPVGGAVRASDFMIMSTPEVSGGLPRPTPSALIDTETLSTIVELTGKDAARLARARVTMQIAESDAGPALVSADARNAGRANDTQRSFDAILKMALLPPGDYVARAIVSVPGEDDVRMIRPFRLTPAAAAPAAAPLPARNADPDAAPAPLPPSRIVAALPRFNMADVLAPRVVKTFLDTLQERHPVSAETIAVFDQARQGRFVAPPADVRTADGDEPALAFIRGLAALEKKEYAQAAAWFQLTLRQASDFLGAAYFLGAVHAAAGRDKDAVGAWQMSLIDGGDSAYPMLVDALLRVGDAEAALELIAEAPDAWPTEDARWRRVGTAQAMLGQYAPALEMLQNTLQKRPEDPDILFLAIQVLYRQHLESPLPSAARDTFADYAARYEKVKGPELALVNSWRRFLLR